MSSSNVDGSIIMIMVNGYWVLTKWKAPRINFNWELKGREKLYFESLEMQILETDFGGNLTVFQVGGGGPRPSLQRYKRGISKGIT